MRVVFCYFVLCAVFSSFAADDTRSNTPPAVKRVNYNDPPREYVNAGSLEWNIYLEKQLFDDSPSLMLQAKARLEKKLTEALKKLPESARERLKKIDIFLMYGPKAKNGGRDNGFEYFQKIASKHNPLIDPRWNGNIVVYSAENFVSLSELWALKAPVHEFAHAYHLQQWPEKQPDIFGAWKSAMNLGLYFGVKDRKGKTIDKAYASVNQLEYFAELTCMYFVECDYHPANRSELNAFDPEGLAMIEKMWGISASKNPLIKIKLSQIDGITKGGNLSPMPPKDVAEKYNQAVVQVAHRGISGTGFLINSDGLISTCAHVLPSHGNTVSVQIQNNGKSVPFEAQIIMRDESLDLALIKAPVTFQCKYIRFEANRALQMGEEVTVIGNPALGSEILSNTMTQGIVSNPSRTLNGSTYIQITAAVNPGTSGGPLFNSYGNVIGLVTIKGNIEAAGFAIPVERIKAFIERCCETGK